MEFEWAMVLSIKRQACSIWGIFGYKDGKES